MASGSTEPLSDIQRDLEAIFELNPPPLTRRTPFNYTTSSTATGSPDHLPIFYNKHFAPELSLRHVEYLPSLVRDLATNTNKAVVVALSTLSPLESFRRAEHCRSEMNYGAGGYGVAQFYFQTIADFCRILASTIALHPKAPGWHSLLVWTQDNDAIADGILRFLYPDSITHDAGRMPILESMERETREICGMLRESISILATWEMRELGASSYEVMAAILKLRKFTWTRCKSCLPKHDKCEQSGDLIPIWPDAKAPPWNLNGNSPITVLNSVRGRADISMLSPMPPPDISPKLHGITKPTSTAFVPPSLPRARPDASPTKNKGKETGRKRKRSGNDGEYAAYKEGVKGDIDTLPFMAAPSEPYRPWKVTRSVARLSQASASASSVPPRAQKQISPTKNKKKEEYRQRKRNDDDDEASKDPHDLTARSMVQQAWTRAVRVDGTVVVLHSGSHEFVCVRHRKTQTLYISDLIDPTTCKDPGYVGLHVGIYIAAVQDAIDRKKQSLSPSPLPEGKDFAGTSNNKDDRDHSKHGSGGRRIPKTRKATIKNIIQAIDDHNAILLYLRYDVYNSPIPATFVRSAPSVLTDTQAQVSPQSVSSYRPADCLTITLTSEVGQGSTGVTHRGTLEMENSDGPGPLDVVVKLAFSSEQRDDLRSEYEVYRTLRSKGVVRGVATALGLFDDTEGDACALVMLYEGVSIREQVLSIPDCKSALSILRSIHHAGILRRDIRRGNILTGDSGIVIIDFGRSRACDDQKAKDHEYARLLHLLEDSDSED